MEGAATQAQREKPAPRTASAFLVRENNGKQFWLSEPGVIGESLAAQPPPLQPPPNPGPSMSAVVGAGVALTAGAIIATVLLTRNHTGYTFLDEGSPLELVLQKPVTLDATQVAGAIAAQ